jgi:hypothetical protein
MSRAGTRRRRVLIARWLFATAAGITQDPIVNSSPVMVNGTLYVGGTNFGFVPDLYVFTLA